MPAAKVEYEWALCECGHDASRHPNYEGRTPYPCSWCGCRGFEIEAITKARRREVIEVAKRLLAPPETWRWFGNAGHFICADDCRFHLTTLVGPWLVSTVGEMVPDSAVRDILAKSRGVELAGRGDERERDRMQKVGFEDIGYQRKYETMVFCADTFCDAKECGGCGVPRPSSFESFDMDGYNSAGEATRGHYAMCEKWANEPLDQHSDQQREGV